MTKKLTLDSYPLKTFILALCISSAIFIPLIVYNRGIFIFIGDFNVQQIPFYQLAHEAVRNGEIFWNWHTDLGANFIGSYSFYLLFSPFFWLTLPFPTAFMPYLMGPLLILKTSMAALTSYFYIKRFVTDNNYAIIGSMLYAFSGFMTFNIFFNHFHDVVVFFPLLLVALEELVTNNRRGYFAIMVAISCVVNYWFFIGEVVFIIIYVIVRIITGGWGCDFKKFCLIALESIIGVLIAMVALLPSVLAILGNPRTGIDGIISPKHMMQYGFDQRLPAIIQSFFFPPEMPSRPIFFPDMGAKWSSLSAWIPLFSTVGVIGYCISKKRDFIKNLIVISLVMAVIPLLNSTFVLFNSSYYARWFYMPVLLMCVATVVCLEQRADFERGIILGFRWTTACILTVAAVVAFYPHQDGEPLTFESEIINGGKELTFGVHDNLMGFCAIIIFTMFCLLIVRLLLFVLTEHKSFTKITLCVLSVIIVVFSLGYLISGKGSKARDDWTIDFALGGRDQLSLPDEGFVRSDFFDSQDNLGMFWGLPNIQAFHSIVPPSVMEFYPAVGVKRDVSSKPPTTHDTLRPLLSVKWFFIKETEEEQSPMPNYTLFDNQLGYNIYENDNFISMGFTYENSISRALIEELSGEQKVRYMLSSLVLEEDAIVRNSDIIKADSTADYSLISASEVQDAIDDRKANTAKTFEIDARGFTATSNLLEKQLMFFSVPYDKGWSVTVNGEEEVVEKANIGFMAVRVPAGDAVIRFEYTTPGLGLGGMVTIVGLSLFGVYLLAMRAIKSKKPLQLEQLDDEQISLCEEIEKTKEPEDEEQQND